MEPPVKLRVVISPAGEVASVERLAGQPHLAHAAERIIRKWRFASERCAITATVTFASAPMAISGRLQRCRENSASLSA